MFHVKQDPRQDPGHLITCRSTLSLPATAVPHSAVSSGQRRLAQSKYAPLLECRYDPNDLGNSAANHVRPYGGCGLPSSGAVVLGSISGEVAAEPLQLIRAFWPHG